MRFLPWRLLLSRFQLRATIIATTSYVCANFFIKKTRVTLRPHVVDGGLAYGGQGVSVNIFKQFQICAGTCGRGLSLILFTIVYGRHTYGAFYTGCCRTRKVPSGNRFFSHISGD